MFPSDCSVSLSDNLKNMGGGNIDLCIIISNFPLFTEPAEPYTQDIIETIVHLWSRNQNKILTYFTTFYVFLSNIAILLI